MTVSGSAHTHILPTARMTPRRQMEMVDVMAESGGSGRSNALHGKFIADRMGLKAKSISSAAGFLTQAGILHPGRGAWALTDLGSTFARLRAEDWRAPTSTAITGRARGSSRLPSAPCPAVHWRRRSWQNC